MWLLVSYLVFLVFVGLSSKPGLTTLPDDGQTDPRGFDYWKKQSMVSGRTFLLFCFANVWVNTVSALLKSDVERIFRSCPVVPNRN